MIDIFAGPGGLGEGFSALRDERGNRTFRVVLSVEMDHFASRTLLLRKFFCQFGEGDVPADYYSYLRGAASVPSLESLLDRYPDAADSAREATWKATLGEESSTDVDSRIRKVLGPKARRKQWVLIGGPPCQAYSLVGRSRMLAKRGIEFYEDKRHTLYREYLRLISRHAPTVFIMENVKGLLSSTTEKGGDLIFGRILRDLRRPPNSNLKYRLFSLSRYDHSDTGDYPAREPEGSHGFVIETERHGVPQRRHRVIICGVLESDYPTGSPMALHQLDHQFTCGSAILGLPRLRSGLSGGEDTPERWLKVLNGACNGPWCVLAGMNGQQDVTARMLQTVKTLSAPKRNRGGRFLTYDVGAACHSEWYLDPCMGGVCNHETRLHMPADLLRYLYVACYGKERGVSPQLQDFPSELLPKHRNIEKAVHEGLFDDRFRVQVAGKPATTVTSHLAKDGHYFIHPDPTQCRSLTVREAARLQTFPDNYFFEGPRTEQYKQVGNAVPPLLARAIAGTVASFLSNGGRE